MQDIPPDKPPIVIDPSATYQALSTKLDLFRAWLADHAPDLLTANHAPADRSGLGLMPSEMAAWNHGYLVALLDIAPLAMGTGHSPWFEARKP